MTTPHQTSVYTKINGELAKWEVDTPDAAEAIEIIQGTMKVRHKAAVLAVVAKPLTN